MNHVICLSVLLALSLTACKSPQKEPAEAFRQADSGSDPEQVHDIIYSLYLPTDVAGLFERTGTNYNPELTAPTRHITLYREPEQMAVMMGVYGVDMSYTKLFEQSADAGSYYSAIQVLAGKLDIPDPIFEASSKRLEKHFNNEDSLASVIEDIYVQTDRYFRENGYENLAALTLFGGWIEAMYIGVKIYQEESRSPEMADRILQQKYALNSMITLLSNHQESLPVAGYILMLKKLRKQFDRVTIRYPREGFEVDTARNKIRAANATITYEPETLVQVNTLVRQIRTALIKADDDS